MSRIRRVHVLLGLPLFLPWLALLGWMAEASWFLTDDAFISFRYARNLLEGHGLVFNPGERVEGYSNFLWVLELAALWGAFGLRPEHAAPWLSTVFTAATLAAMLWWVARWPALPHRWLVAWMAMGLVCGSATFAVWTSGGGLETRQFTFLVVLAVVCLGLHRDRRPGLLAASLCLALAALTRPEGPLVAACCFGWFAFQRRADTGRWRPDWRDLASLGAPFAAVVVAHYLFRYGYYGEWLPNTYHAKHVRPWYEAGFRYLWAAALETGLYLLAPLALAGLWARWRTARDGTCALALACVAVHAAYVARIGGDHFEWRPLDFYWPLLAVPAAAGIARLGAGAANRAYPRAFQALSKWWGVPPRFRWPGTRTCALVLFAPVLFYAGAMQGALLFESARSGKSLHESLPELDERDAGWLLAAPGMETINAVASDLRRNLNRQNVGNRFADHGEFVEWRLRRFRPYESMERGALPDDAVTARGDIGVFSFYIPDLKVIDTHGLTDATIARHPVSRPNSQRSMAHDRCVPPGYLDERGVRFHEVFPAASSEAEALGVAPYAVRVGSGLWMPFDADRRWVRESFAAFSDRESVNGRLASPVTVAAVIVGDGSAAVGEEFVVRLSDATRTAGVTDRGTWRFERGNDKAGWSRFPNDGLCGESFRYIVSEADVGHRLRAHVLYTDAAGNRVKAVTPASAPVAGR